MQPKQHGVKLWRKTIICNIFYYFFIIILKQKKFVKFCFSETLDEIKRVANEVPHRITSALTAQKIMERQIRAEDPEIVHFAPPYKVTSKIYLCFPYTKIAIF